MLAPADTVPNTIDQGGKWFWNFLKQELSPYPGRLWIVGRITISATIVMILVMTFRIPNGYLGAFFTLLLSRENPTATLLAGFRTVLIFLIGTPPEAIAEYLGCMALLAARVRNAETRRLLMRAESPEAILRTITGALV